MGQQGAEARLVGSCVLRCWALARAPGGTRKKGGRGEKRTGVYERMEEQGKEQGDLRPTPSPRSKVPGINLSPLRQPPGGLWGTARGFQHFPSVAGRGQPVPRATMGCWGLQGKDGCAPTRCDQQQREHMQAGAGGDKATTQQGLEVCEFPGVHPQQDG